MLPHLLSIWKDSMNAFVRQGKHAYVNVKQGIVSHQEHQTKEVGVAFPECNHLSALNLHSVLPWQVMVPVKLDEGIFAFYFFIYLFFKRQKMSKRHLAAAQKWMFYTLGCTMTWSIFSTQNGKKMAEVEKKRQPVFNTAFLRSDVHHKTESLNLLWIFRLHH